MQRSNRWIIWIVVAVLLAVLAWFTRIGIARAWLSSLTNLTIEQIASLNTVLDLIASCFGIFAGCVGVYKFFRKSIVGEPATATPMAPWTDPQTGNSLLAVGMPLVGQSDLEKKAKVELYGGKASGAWTPLEYVARAQTFDRETVTVFAERIRKVREPYGSFTLQADQGAGLSIALAQLVRDFSGDSATLVVSKIGDRNGTRDFLEKMDVPDPMAVARWLRSLSRKRVLIVIDDVSNLAGVCERQIVNLKNNCRDGVSRVTGYQIIFVFGSFGAVNAIHDTGKIELELTANDRAACYEKMTAQDDPIIEGVQGIVAEGRMVGDDAQALIDFYLQRGRPFKKTMENWLARTDDLSPEKLELVDIVAVAALVGLDIPEEVALRLCQSRGLTEFLDAAEIARWTNRLTVTQVDDYGGTTTGIGLSCSRRAVSILGRSGKLSSAFVDQTLEELLGIALDLSEKPGKNGGIALEFSRHIFQRLGNRGDWRFGDKKGIGAGLLSGLDARLDKLSVRWSPELLAKWAGSITPWMKGAHYPDWPDLQERCVALVASLMLRCLDALDKDPTAMAPQIAVSLCRAARRLPFSGDHPSSIEVNKQVALCRGRMANRLKPIDIVTLVGVQMTGGRADDQRRANELVTAYAGYRASLIDRAFQYFPTPDPCRDLTLVFEGAAQHGMIADAGTLLEKARFVLTPQHDGVYDESALRRRNDMVDQAKDSVTQNPLTQAKWQDSIQYLGNKLIHPQQARVTAK